MVLFHWGSSVKINRLEGTHGPILSSPRMRAPLHLRPLWSSPLLSWRGGDPWNEDAKERVQERWSQLLFSDSWHLRRKASWDCSWSFKPSMHVSGVGSHALHFGSHGAGSQGAPSQPGHTGLTWRGWVSLTLASIFGALLGEGGVAPGPPPAIDQCLTSLPDGMSQAINMGKRRRPRKRTY